MWWMDRRMAEWRCSNINITKRTASVVCKWVLTEQFCVCLKFSVTKYCKGEGAGGGNGQIQSYKNGRAAALGLRPSSNVKELQTCPQGNAEGSTPGLTPDLAAGFQKGQNHSTSTPCPWASVSGPKNRPRVLCPEETSRMPAVYVRKGKRADPVQPFKSLETVGKIGLCWVFNSEPNST